MKEFVRTAINDLVARAPWGVREALLEACIRRIGAAEVTSRLFPKLNIKEIGALGVYGIMSSAWNDRLVLMEYGRTGTISAALVNEFMNFFGEEGGTYIDVGANIGMTVVPIAQKPNVRCIAFEPEPGNFDFLRRNVGRNVMEPNVAFHQAAVGERRSVMPLALADSNLGDHRLTKTGVAGRNSIDVDLVPLDDYLDEVVGPLAVKIDTQGAEPSVVAGGGRVLARAGLIAIEFCPFLIRELSGDPGLIINLVSNFDEVSITPAGAAFLSPFVPATQARAVLEEKVRTAMADDGDYVDVLARR